MKREIIRYNIDDNIEDEKNIYDENIYKSISDINNTNMRSYNIIENDISNDSRTKFMNWRFITNNNCDIYN